VLQRALRRGLHPWQNALVGSNERAVDIDGHKTDSHSRLPRYHKNQTHFTSPLRVNQAAEIHNFFFF
jgi:hypothetical protein